MQTIAYNSELILYAGLKHGIQHNDAYKMFIGPILSETGTINISLEELQGRQEQPFKILEAFIKDSSTNNITFISNENV